MSRTVKTTADGRFEFSALADQPVALRVKVEGKTVLKTNVADLGGEDQLLEVDL
ncbi:MAG: hypothetical protein QF404_07035 [Planctomycetota bacterium]|nr:hypothetical protein [Planctomycetota bacterium]MDP6940265.1 hypothetical protein [Planctomycetota bacterium]